AQYHPKLYPMNRRAKPQRHSRARQSHCLYATKMPRMSPVRDSPERRVLAPPVAGVFFRSTASDDFVKQSLLVAVFSQQAAESLHVFASRAAAGQHNAYARGRYVDAFVQNLARHNDWVFAGVKSFEDLLALLRLGLMRDRGNEILASDPIDGGIIGGENQNS